MKNMIKLSVIAGAIFVLSAGISANASAAGTNWKPVCVNGSDSQGNHNGTWSQINKETTAGGWTKVGRCIPPPPPPAPAPAPIVYVAPPAPMYSAPTYAPTAYTAPAYDPYAYTAPAYDPYAYTAPAYDPTAYTAPAYDPYAVASAVNSGFTGWVGGDPTVINIAANTSTGYTGTGPLITGGGGGGGTTGGDVTGGGGGGGGGDGSGNLGSLITYVGGGCTSNCGAIVDTSPHNDQICTGDCGPPTVTQTTPAAITVLVQNGMNAGGGYTVVNDLQKAIDSGLLAKSPIVDLNTGLPIYFIPRSDDGISNFSNPDLINPSTWGGLGLLSDGNNPNIVNTPAPSGWIDVDTHDWNR